MADTKLAVIGGVIVIVALFIYFMLPLNSFLGLSQTNQLSLLVPNITLSTASKFCDSPILALMSGSLCNTIQFLTYAIYFMGFIGAVLIYKGISG